MKDIIILVVFSIYGIMGYFLMKRLDEFIKNNKNVDIIKNIALCKRAFVVREFYFEKSDGKADNAA